MAAAKNVRVSAITFYLLGHFYASYHQLTIPNRGLLLRAYHASHPPMHRSLPLWLSAQLPTAHNLCMFAANVKSKKDDVTINYCEPESGWLHGILIGGRGNRHCYVVKHFERQQQLGGERACHKITIQDNAILLDLSQNEMIQKLGSKTTCKR